MFIEAIEGVWTTNPLQQTRFLLRDPDDITALKSSAITAVVINTAKGIDPDAPMSDLGGDPLASRADRQKTDVLEARQTVQQASMLLGNMFANARVGGAVTVHETAAIVADISRSIDHNPSVFFSVTRLKSKDEITFVHSVSVSALLIHFGRYLGLDAAIVDLLGMGGLLHDIGKVELPREILNKAGGLDERELKIMRRHPQLGYDILCKQQGMPDIVLDICQHHHERIDGRGYPDQLSDADFTVPARMAAICDVYDAVTSERPYKRTWSAGEALTWMLKRDGQFDRQLLKKFALCLTTTLGRPA